MGLVWMPLSALPSVASHSHLCASVSSHVEGDKYLALGIVLRIA